MFMHETLRIMKLCHFCDFIVHNSLKPAWNCSKFYESIDHDTLYKCVKFEKYENVVFTHFYLEQKEQTEEERNKENQMVFSNTYLAQISLKFGM